VLLETGEHFIGEALHDSYYYGVDVNQASMDDINKFLSILRGDFINLDLLSSYNKEDLQKIINKGPNISPPSFKGIKLHPRDGDYDLGTFVDGYLEGKGKRVEFYWDVGLLTIYEGEFLNGNFTGKGKRTEIYQNGEVHTFEGGFLNGVPHGQTRNTISSGYTFEGLYINNSMKNGIITYPNGRQYKGTRLPTFGFIGEANFIDGKVQKGHFMSGALHGHGSEVFVDGVVFLGEWFNGERHGRGITVHQDGTRELQVWENGTLISSEPL